MGLFGKKPETEKQIVDRLCKDAGAPKQEVGKLSAEVMIYMSKLDDDSFL